MGYTRVIRSMQFDLGKTAAGKETKPHAGSKPPFSSISGRVVSDQRSAMKIAAIDAGAYRYLLLKMTAAVINQGRSNGNSWQFRDNQVAMASIVLDSLIYAESLSDAKSAEKMRISKSSYQKTWKKRVAGMVSDHRAWRAT